MAHKTQTLNGAIEFTRRSAEARSKKPACFILLFLTLILSGCTVKAYDGPQLEKSEIAVLHRLHRHGSSLALFGLIPLPHEKHSAKIIKVDGTTLGTGREIHVRPGLHAVEINYIKFGIVTLCGAIAHIPTGCTHIYDNQLSIKFTAEAGHEYSVPAERRNEQDWIWVEDITTGKVVAGAKPPPEQAKPAS